MSTPACPSCTRAQNIRNDSAALDELDRVASETNSSSPTETPPANTEETSSLQTTTEQTKPTSTNAKSEFVPARNHEARPHLSERSSFSEQVLSTSRLNPSSEFHSKIEFHPATPEKTSQRHELINRSELSRSLSNNAVNHSTSFSSSSTKLYKDSPLQNRGESFSLNASEHSKQNTFVKNNSISEKQVFLNRSGTNTTSKEVIQGLHQAATFPSLKTNTLLSNKIFQSTPEWQGRMLIPSGLAGPLLMSKTMGPSPQAFGFLGSNTLKPILNKALAGTLMTFPPLTMNSTRLQGPNLLERFQRSLLRYLNLFTGNLYQNTSQEVLEGEVFEMDEMAIWYSNLWKKEKKEDKKKSGLFNSDRIHQKADSDLSDEYEEEREEFRNVLTGTKSILTMQR